MTNFDPFDFQAIRREQAQWRDQATRELVPGIDPAELTKGQKVTISPNLRTGDRSWTGEIHTVLAINSMHVQTRTRPRFGSDRPLLLLVTEHHFYSAEGFEPDEDLPAALSQHEGDR